MTITSQLSSYGRGPNAAMEATPPPGSAAGGAWQRCFARCNAAMQSGEHLEHDESCNSCGDQWSRRFQKTAGTIRRSPYVLVMPIVFLGIIMGLGLWGVLHASRQEEKHTKEKMQRQLAGILDMYHMTLDLVTFPLVQLYGVVKNEPDVPVLQRYWSLLVHSLLSPAANRIVSLEVVGQEWTIGVYPENANTSQLMGRDLFAPGSVPDIHAIVQAATAALPPNVTLSWVRTDPDLTQPPRMFFTVPIAFDNSTVDEVWNATVPPCRPELCWHPVPNKTKLWGSLILEVAIGPISNKISNPLNVLLENGYNVMVLAPVSTSNYLVPEPLYVAPDTIKPSDCDSTCMNQLAVLAGKTGFNTEVQMVMWPMSGTWAPTYTTPLLVLMVVISVVLAVLLFMLLLSRRENQALIERLLPSHAIKRLRTEWDWSKEALWKSMQDLEQDTPAQQMLVVINKVLVGEVPNPELLLCIKRALHDGQDVYRPGAADIGQRIQQAPGMDDEVRKALLTQLVGAPQARARPTVHLDETSSCSPSVADVTAVATTAAAATAAAAPAHAAAHGLLAPQTLLSVRFWHTSTGAAPPQHQQQGVQRTASDADKPSTTDDNAPAQRRQHHHAHHDCGPGGGNGGLPDAADNGAQHPGHKSGSLHKLAGSSLGSGGGGGSGTLELCSPVSGAMVVDMLPPLLAMQRGQSKRHSLGSAADTTLGMVAEAYMWAPSVDLAGLCWVGDSGGSAPGSGPAPATALPMQMMSIGSLVHNTAERMLMQVDEWSLDTFALDEATHGRALSVLGFWLLSRSGLIKRFGLHDVRLARYLRAVEACYPEANPYHNRRHGASVLHVMHVIMTHSMLGGYVDDLTQLACYLAAIVHDLGHLGVNNDFLVNSRHQLALLYNDRSPMENHHVSAAWTLLEQPDLNFVEGLPKPDLLQMRKLIIDLVLATDMKQHFVITGQFNALHGIMPASGSGYNSKTHSRVSENDHERVHPLSDNDRVLSLQMALKCADLGHVVAHLPLHLRWVQALEQEFFMQGDRERALGLPVSPLCDRNTEGVFKSQVGFYSFIVMPLLNAFVRRFRAAEPLMKMARTNQRHWQAEAHASPELQAAAAAAAAGNHNLDKSVKGKAASTAATPTAQAVVTAISGAGLSSPHQRV